MQSKILLFFIFGLLFSCTEGEVSTRKKSEKRVTKNYKHIPYLDPNALDSISEFSLKFINKKFLLSPGEKIDFKNFTYEDCILRNGVSYSESDFGFDTIRLIQDYKISDSLFLVELYEYYGGGSSEIMKIIYLFQREPNYLILKSSLSCEGNYPIEVKNNKLVVKSDNYIGGESARCCPWKYEVAEFEITKDSLKYISRKFKDIPK